MDRRAWVVIFVIILVALILTFIFLLEKKDKENITTSVEATGELVDTN